MRAFTLEEYKQLIESLVRSNYEFVKVENHLAGRSTYCKHVILRHDVDRRPQNALQMAKAEHSLGITSTYYFRATRNSFNKQIMQEIQALGHDVGYHYEDFFLCRYDPDLAIDSFRKIYANLEVLLMSKP